MASKAVVCPRCGGNGTGVAERKDKHGHAMWLVVCPRCNGKGKVKAREGHGTQNS